MWNYTPLEFFDIERKMINTNWLQPYNDTLRSFTFTSAVKRKESYRQSCPQDFVMRIKEILFNTKPQGLYSL